MTTARDYLGLTKPRVIPLLLLVTLATMLLASEGTPSWMAISVTLLGGTLAIGGEENDGQIEVVVQIEGQRILLDPELRATLIDGEQADGVTPRTAGCYLVHDIVRGAGGSVMVSEPAEGVMIFGAVFNAG